MPRCNAGRLDEKLAREKDGDIGSCREARHGNRGAWCATHLTLLVVRDHPERGSGDFGGLYGCTGIYDRLSHVLLRRKHQADSSRSEPGRPARRCDGRGDRYVGAARPRGPRARGVVARRSQPPRRMKTSANKMLLSAEFLEAGDAPTLTARPPGRAWANSVPPHAAPSQHSPTLIFISQVPHDRIFATFPVPRPITTIILQWPTIPHAAIEPLGRAGALPSRPAF